MDLKLDKVQEYQLEKDIIENNGFLVKSYTVWNRKYCFNDTWYYFIKKVHIKDILDIALHKDAHAYAKADFIDFQLAWANFKPALSLQELFNKGIDLIINTETGKLYFLSDIKNCLEEGLETSGWEYRKYKG